MSIRNIIYGCCLLLLFSACNSDDEFEGFVNYKDKKLRTLLREKSPTGHLDYFKLPEPSSLGDIPQDPLNPLTPLKIELGKQLFHETGIGVANKESAGMTTFSCASCHHAGSGFQAGVAQGIGEGGLGFGSKGEGRYLDPVYPIDSIDVQPIRTPTILNAAYQTNMLWNGQFGATGVNIDTESNWTKGTPKEVNALGYEGLESQAIAGMSVHRLDVDKQLLATLGYLDLFDQVFGSIAEAERYNRVTAGLAIAAYERTVMTNKAPFQKWLTGEELISDRELDGAFLFFDKAGCSDCHSGPALNDMSFHALGMNDLELTEATLITNPLNSERKGRGGFTGNVEDDYKFKVPQLYNLKGIEFLGHGSTFNTIKEVIQYKNEAVPENVNVQKNQISELFVPLNLSTEEIDLITFFIETSLYDSEISRHVPNELSSGNCFPNADRISKEDLNCN